jgi:hypothetical protein
MARQAVLDALPAQSAPMVQVALIDFLVDIKDRDAVMDLRNLADASEVNDLVKQRALWALGELQ